MRPYRVWGLRFPEIRGTILRGPRTRTVVAGDYIGVPLFKETTISPSPRRTLIPKALGNLAGTSTA